MHAGGVEKRRREERGRRGLQSAHSLIERLYSAGRSDTVQNRRLRVNATASVPSVVV